MGINPKLELDIGELSLDGFSHMDQKSLSSALEAELTRLLKEGGVPPNFLTNTATTQLDFGVMDLAANSGPRFIGRQIAKTIYSGFKQKNTFLPMRAEALTKEPATPKNQTQNMSV